MRYRLRFDIGYDSQHWSLDTFERDRELFYKQLLKKYASENGKIDDATLEFPRGTPELANELIQVAERTGFDYNIWTFVEYTSEEIINARFVPFFIRGEQVDHDKYGVYFNKYPLSQVSNEPLSNSAQISGLYLFNRLSNP